MLLSVLLCYSVFCVLYVQEHSVYCLLCVHEYSAYCLLCVLEHSVYCLLCVHEHSVYCLFYVHEHSISACSIYVHEYGLLLIAPLTLAPRLTLCNDLIILRLWHASLRHPAGTTPLPEGEPCMYTYICDILALFSPISLPTHTVRTNS